jgi:hypothetical protein
MDRPRITVAIPPETLHPAARPQPAPGAPLRFLLDVHPGTPARRLRLLGVDAGYESEDIGDPAAVRPRTRSTPTAVLRRAARTPWPARRNSR